MAEELQQNNNDEYCGLHQTTDKIGYTTSVCGERSGNCELPFRLAVVRQQLDAFQCIFEVARERGKAKLAEQLYAMRRGV